MKQNDKTNRYERKYYINKNSAILLEQRLSYVLKPDIHASLENVYLVSSMYFDDKYDSSWLQKQNGLLIRNKFRVRYYNRNMEVIHLECKCKNGEIISKESTEITEEQYHLMRDKKYTFMAKSDDPLLQKFYITHKLKHLQPVTMIEYKRKAYTYKPGNVRITLDMELGVKSLNNHFFEFSLPNDTVILEVKYDHFLPSVVTQILAGFPLTQTAISKYVIARENMLI